MNFLRKLLSLISITLVLPGVLFAQVTDVFDLAGLIYYVLVGLGRFFFVLAVAFFFWGVIKFIKNANDVAERELGKKYIIWALIAFVVIFSLWAIINIFLVNALGILPGGAPGFVDKDGNPV